MPMRIDDVKVSNRYRKDLGDIASLAASIKEIGLLNPITVTYDGELIAGQRRVEAFKLLGYEEIPAIAVKDLSTAVKWLTAERDENEERKEMTVSERVALGQALEELERPRAERRRREAASRAGKIARGTYKPDTSSSGSGDPKDEEAGKVLDVVAGVVGMSEATYRRARTVVKSATDPDAPPEVRETARTAMAGMDASGKVVPAYNKVQEARGPQRKRPALPETTTGQRPEERRKPTIPSATKQRKALNNAGPVLDGLCMGLEQIVVAGLDEAIDAEEAALWVDGLAKSRRTIERVINLLKERSNA